MKNRIILFIGSILLVSATYSQNPHLTIEGSNGKFYLDHTVAAKENWYSIGRLFNLPPHDIANYNNMSFDKPLEIGQQIHIPLNTLNFDQKAVKTSGESLIPVYHLVLDKEWAFKLSSIYNDVPVTSLEKWNKIKRDDIKPGSNIIVGFLKVKTDLSPLAVGLTTNPAIGPASAETPVKTDKPADLSSVQATNKPPAVVPASAAAQSTSKPVSQPAANTGTPAANIIPANNTSERVNSYAISHSTGGFFSIDYTGSGKNSNGQAGTFKSTSGWTDGKYYALMNGVPVGTIIRVSGTNGKTIYAKVLGQLPDMKESNGLLARISNAASAELGLGEGKFPVEIKY
jgi:LysM repeat protein